jgi:cytosine/adenosine deaminase-related metal-dependent hydrolase
MNDCGSATPVAIFSKIRESATSLEMTGLHWLLVHMNEVSENDFQILERSKAKFSIVHCPRSHRYFGRRPFSLQKFREHRFNICLGTDSLASNEDLSLFGEMRVLQQAQPALSPSEILEMVTVNPARALGVGDYLGKIRVGYRADLIAVPAKSQLDELIAHRSGVSWMMSDGKVIASNNR